MMRSRAIDFMYDWRSRPVETYQAIYKYWHETWRTKEEFEEELRKDVKGHDLEMVFFRRKYEEKIQWNK